MEQTIKKTNLIKSMFSKNNVFYTIIFLINIIIIAINRAINGFDSILWICDISSIFSVLNIIFNAKHTIWGLVFNFIATLFIAATDIIQHIWLNAFICIVINAPMLLYGIIRWHKNTKAENENKNLNTLSTKWKIIIWSAFALCSVGFTFLLKSLGGNLYVFDAIYSSGCVFGVILCSFAYIDQFKIFTVANVFGLIMYIMLTVQNPNNVSLIFTSVMFLVMNIVGFFNWRKIIKSQKMETNTNQSTNTIGN